MEETKLKTGLNKTWLLVAGLVILTVVLLVVSINSSNAPTTPTGSKNVEADIAFTTLTISEAPRISSVSGIYEMDVLINSDKNEITGVQVEISFDPEVLSRVDILPADFLDSPEVLIKDIDSKNGRITFALGNRRGVLAAKGSGVIAVLSFSKFGTEPTNISFLPHTAVSAPGHNQSVLRESVSAVIGQLPTPTTRARIQIPLSPAISPVTTP